MRGLAQFVHCRDKHVKLKFKHQVHQPKTDEDAQDPGDERVKELSQLNEALKRY